MTGFTHQQLGSAVSMVDELRRIPSTARSVRMNFVQLGTPPVTTGFHEIAVFRVPSLQVATPRACTPHSTGWSGIWAASVRIRANGGVRTESAVIITTDGFANDTTPKGLAKSIDAFLAVGRTWSVTSLVVGVGNRLNETLLKRLTNGIAPLQVRK